MKPSIQKAISANEFWIKNLQYVVDHNFYLYVLQAVFVFKQIAILYSQNLGLVLDSILFVVKHECFLDAF